MGVLVRFATVARGTTHPSYALLNHRESSRGRHTSVRESDTVSSTRSSIVHRLRRVPAHLANIDLQARRFFHLPPRSTTLARLFVRPVHLPSISSTLSSLRKICLPTTLRHPRVLLQPPSLQPISLENNPPPLESRTRSPHRHIASTAACLPARI